MSSTKYFGILGGLIFGLVWIWQGAGAAFIVLAFVLLGWLIGLAFRMGNRVASGEVDLDAVRQLIAMVFTSSRRS